MEMKPQQPIYVLGKPSKTKANRNKYYRCERDSSLVGMGAVMEERGQARRLSPVFWGGKR
jgi:hypothetical protein